ncbi:MAG TPA: hypothetical protein VGL57_00295 [Solirubrobacteraceae bacterium]|jgi:hypothetical protein
MKLTAIWSAVAALFIAIGAFVSSHHTSTPQIEPSSFSSVNVTYVTSRSIGIEPGEQAGGFATCPSGQIAVGGGGYGSSANPAQNMDASEPRKGSGSSVPNQWAAFFNNGTGTPDSFIVYAVCISPAHANVAGSFVQH